MVYNDSVAVTDTIHGFLCDCITEVPADGGTFRIKALEDYFFGYEIEQPRDYRGLITVTGDDLGPEDNPSCYVIKIAPNESETSRLFTIPTHSIKKNRNPRASFYQPPRQQ